MASSSVEYFLAFCLTAAAALAISTRAVPFGCEQQILGSVEFCARSRVEVSFLSEKRLQGVGGKI